MKKIMIAALMAFSLNAIASSGKQTFCVQDEYGNPISCAQVNSDLNSATHAE